MAYGRSRPPGLPTPEAVVRTVIAGLIAGIALGGAAYAIGLIGTLITDWALVLAFSLVTSAVFVALLERIGRSPYTPLPIAKARFKPLLGACVGGVYGTVCGLVIVAYGAHLWVTVVAGVDITRPDGHGPSLISFTWFGIVLGAWYPLLRDVID